MRVRKNEINIADYDDFQQKLHDQIQEMMDRTSVIHPPIEIPHPLPPFKPDDVTLEKLDWIVPPIPVDLNDYVPEVDVEELEKPADECRKEV
jgi:hypothetical protein